MELARPGRESAVGPGSLLAKAGLWPPCSRKRYLLLTCPKGTVEREASGQRLPCFFTTPVVWLLSCSCLPASGPPQQSAAQGPHTHTQAGQSGGLAQEAGPIHTLWSRNRRARKMRLLPGIPRQLNTVWRASCPGSA